MPLTLRIAQERDVRAMTAIYAPFVLRTPISFELTPPTEEEMLARLNKTLPQYPWLVAIGDEAVVGYAYASKHRERVAYQWAADVSIYLHQDWRGKGLGRALYTSLFAFLREQGYMRVYAGITLPNPASVGLHEALGMSPVGIFRQVGFKLGAWHDVGWWQGSLQTLVSDPPLPRPITEVAAWESCIAAGQALLLHHG